MKINPTQVFSLEQIEDESIRRLGNKRIDPQTGDEYNLEVNPPSDEATSNRLLECPEDMYDQVKARYAVWNKVSIQIEDAYKVQL